LKSPNKKPSKNAVSKAGLRRPKKLSRPQRLIQTEEVIRRLRQLNPNPRCELYYTTPFQLLVSVALSAQTTDKMVNTCMQPVYDEGGFDPKFVAALGPDGLLKIIRRIGLAPTKSKRVVELAKILIEKHGGEVPQTREELEDLPGVGRKTANVILGELYGQPTIAVDTHVFRVSYRLGLHGEKTPEKCELVLLDLIKKKHLPAAHHWFILHGRYTCKAVNPACESCSLADICPSCPIVKPT
jgi:endonuclease-3